jgi:hypothetical protein
MLICIVSIFFVSWAPITINNLLVSFNVLSNYNTGILWHLRIGFYVMSYINSCINPIVYAFMSENFREGFKRSFRMTFRLKSSKNLNLNQNHHHNYYCQRDCRKNHPNKRLCDITITYIKNEPNYEEYKSSLIIDNRPNEILPPPDITINGISDNNDIK